MRPPRGGHLDGNHRAIVDALHRAGIRTLSLAGVGNGCPDILAAFRDTLVLLECKDGALAPSRRQLTKAEAEFVATWPKTYVVTSPEEAVRVVVESARPGGGVGESLGVSRKSLISG